MNDRKIIRIDGGSTEYWRERRQAVALIRAAELAAKRLADARCICMAATTRTAT